VVWLTVLDGAVEIDVLVVPRSSRHRIAGVHEDRLKVQLNAPPVDGEANAALVELLARSLGLRKKDVEIVAGSTGRRKRIRATGATEAAARALARNAG
jgi:uncharacterized protein (TIGR00251 family)